MYQSLLRINRALLADASDEASSKASGEALGKPATNTELQHFFAEHRQRGGRLHLAGLLSDGGVHSHLKHLFALCRLAKEAGITNFCVHVFTDGRDTNQKSAAAYLGQLEKCLQELGTGTIASVSGRLLCNGSR